MKTSLILSAAAVKISRFKLAAVSITIALAALLLASQPVFADVSITGPISYSYVDGTAPIEISIIFTLDSGSPVTVSMNPFSAWDTYSAGEIPQGSLSDGDYASGPASALWSAMLAAPGDSATYTYDITNTGYNDLDGDTWVLHVPGSANGTTFGFDYSIASGTSPVVMGTWNPPVELTDTPEPSSLYLFGTGLLGFAGFMRRKFSRS